MPTATHRHSTLCLNASNHPSIPPEGLVLEADVPKEVTPEQAEYLETLCVEIARPAPTQPNTPRAAAR